MMYRRHLLYFYLLFALIFVYTHLFSSDIYIFSISMVVSVRFHCRRRDPNCNDSFTHSLTSSLIHSLTHSFFYGSISLSTYFIFCFRLYVTFFELYEDGELQILMLHPRNGFFSFSSFFCTCMYAFAWLLS